MYINELHVFYIRALQKYFNLCGTPTNTQQSNMPDHVLLMTTCFGHYCEHHEGTCRYY